MDEEKNADKKMILPVFLMGGLFILIYALALLMIQPFDNFGMKVFTNPDDPMNLVVFFAIIFGMTVVILLIAKFWRKWLIQALILFAVGYTSFYVFLPLSSLILPNWFPLILSISAAVSLTLILYKFPEWYIIDI